jgi:hypothetical protein
VKSAQQSDQYALSPICRVNLADVEAKLPTEHKTRIIANKILSRRVVSREGYPMWDSTAGDSVENTPDE